MTNTATLNTSNTNSIKYAREKEKKKERKKRLKNKTQFLSKTSHYTNRAIIKQNKTNSNYFFIFFLGERERARDRQFDVFHCPWL